jgi:hypothetical protein
MRFVKKPELPLLEKMGKLRSRLSKNRQLSFKRASARRYTVRLRQNKYLGEGKKRPPGR